MIAAPRSSGGRSPRAGTCSSPGARARARRRCSTRCPRRSTRPSGSSRSRRPRSSGSAQPHVVRLEARPANAEGAGAVSVRDLVRTALRMRPDRIVVGEVRGAEALDLLQALNTGHEGALSTVHANSPVDALRRLATLSLFSGVALPFEAITEQVAAAVDVVVQVERGSSGARRDRRDRRGAERARRRSRPEPLFTRRSRRARSRRRAESSASAARRTRAGCELVRVIAGALVVLGVLATAVLVTAARRAPSLDRVRRLRPRSGLPLPGSVRERLTLALSRSDVDLTPGRRDQALAPRDARRRRDGQRAQPGRRGAGRARRCSLGGPVGAVVGARPGRRTCGGGAPGRARPGRRPGCGPGRRCGESLRDLAGGSGALAPDLRRLEARSQLGVGLGDALAQWSQRAAAARGACRHGCARPRGERRRRVRGARSKGSASRCGPGRRRSAKPTRSRRRPGSRRSSSAARPSPTSCSSASPTRARSTCCSPPTRVGRASWSGWSSKGSPRCGCGRCCGASA